MAKYTSDDQWRSFQAFVAAYLAGMLHPLDVFTISRKSAVLPPLMEFRCDAAGRLWLGFGAESWSDEDGATVHFSREEANQVAAKMVEALRKVPKLDDPSDLRLSGSGPASSVAVLATGGFMNGGSSNAAREAAQRARMSAHTDVEGDVIDAAAREAGDETFARTKSGSIAAIVSAEALARLRSWVDPFSPTPKTGVLVGGSAPRETDATAKHATDGQQPQPKP